ncbi:MAG: hypothetical protein BAA02_07315 [Paenibacillaceae bacterium ZCTH02-B3]|nr:MAG: hypothetical protein BAA02_07315 [Paenibacillaceae bacterium ZCTH02-B3]
MKQILVFILFSSILCWMMFAPVYRHVAILRQALLQKEADYLLEVGASGRYGYIDANMIDESRRRLESRGFDPALLEYDVGATDGTDAANPERPVPRGTGIRLVISYPYGNLFVLDRLIGLEPVPGEARMSAGGVKMSEYVPGM